jgi:hypothetical protein
VKVSATILFFVLINVLSFGAMFYGFPVSFVLFICGSVFLLMNVRRFFPAVGSKASFWFAAYVFTQVFSYINYIIIDYSRDVAVTYPGLLLNGVSYLLIPQLLFYFIGFNLANTPIQVRDQVQKRLAILFGAVYALGLCLHFIRPGFFNAFIARTFLSEIGTGYIDFYPRMTIYWNSMIVGVLGVAFFWITIYAREIKPGLKWTLGLIFLASILFSTQRGAWAALGVSTLIYLFLNFSLRKMLFLVGGVGVVSVLGTVLLNLFAEESSYGMVVDLLNRFDNIEEAFSERKYQFDNFIYIITHYPFGVGLGLLSHKAADLGLVLTTPDGNYYRIFGELGVFGVMAFVMLMISTLFRAFVWRMHVVFIVCIVYILQALGTNVFDLYAAGFLFWFLVGWVGGTAECKIQSKALGTNFISPGHLDSVGYRPVSE